MEVFAKLVDSLLIFVWRRALVAIALASVRRSNCTPTAGRSNP
jgi:hypothetical protein